MLLLRAAPLREALTATRLRAREGLSAGVAAHVPRDVSALGKV
jgi:hypothetical protein